MGPVVLALVAALPARAVDVSWRGDPRCPQDGFQDSLARYLEGASEPRAVQVTVEVRRGEGATWTAALSLVTADGRSERALRGRSCADVSDAAAFVTAVVVDPGVLTRPAGAAVVPAPEAGHTDMSPETSSKEDLHGVTDMSSGTSNAAAEPAASATAAGASAADVSDMSSGAGDEPLDAFADRPAGRDGDRDMAEETPVASTTARPRGFVRLVGGIEALGMPRVGPQAGLAAGVLGGSWRAELTALYRAPTTHFTAVDPNVGARVRLWAVGARGCWVGRAGRVEFPLCGGLEVGQALGEGVGFVGARTDRIAWAAAVLGPALAWAPRPWLALWLGADLGVPLLRGTFSAAGLGPMYEIAPVSLRAAAGLEFRFGRAS